MNYEQLKDLIAQKVKENGRGEITGPILQAVLLAMVDALGEINPQEYTEEQKAQARANIEALANFEGEITEDKLSVEVQAILNDVANKQYITDKTLQTTAKTIVGAINEVYGGGLADNAVTETKLAQSIQTILGMVGTNVKEIDADTNLNDLKEEGIYVLMSNHIYSNLPYSDGVSMTSQRVTYPSILLVSDYVVANNMVQTYIGLSSIYSYPLIKWRQHNGNTGKWLDWRGADVYGIKKDVTALRNLIFPIAILSENTPDNIEQNAKNFADYINKAKAAGISDVNGMMVTCLIDNDYSGVGYFYGIESILGVVSIDDVNEHYVFNLTKSGIYSQNAVLTETNTMTDAEITKIWEDA